MSLVSIKKTCYLHKIDYQKEPSLLYEKGMSTRITSCKENSLKGVRSLSSSFSHISLFRNYHKILNKDSFPTNLKIVITSLL